MSDIVLYLQYANDIIHAKDVVFMFEKAKWISKGEWGGWALPGNDNLGACPMFAKTFAVEKAVKSATLYAVGLGQADFYLNGKRVDYTARTTHPTNFQKTVIYNVYNVTDGINVGKNRIGAILGHVGYCDTKFLWRSVDKLLLQLDIEYTDGTTESIVSDKTFKVHDSHILFSAKLCGEKQDANLIIKNWCDPDFDDSEWKNANITKSPGGKLRTTACPSIKTFEVIKGKEISKNVYDFGVNISGHARLTVKGNKGNEIQLLYSERFNKETNELDRTNILANTGYHPMGHKDVFILSGETDVFEQLFTYHGFQYVQIVGEYESITVEAIVTHTDLKEAASFWCDNEMINAIHEATVRSILTNAHGYLVDCPHREQNPWTGDGLMSAEAVNIGFDAYEMFYEWMLKFKDDQYESGGLGGIVPMVSIPWEYNFANGPDWDSAIIHIPYMTFKYTGKREIVDALWDNMCKTLNYFKTLSETNLLSCGLGDWAPEGERCSVQITDTTYYMLDALYMAEMAEATGRDSAPFKELAENIKREFREVYIKDGKFSVMHQTALACAIKGGFLTDEEKIKAVADLKNLLKENGYAFILGCHGLVMIFDALSENGGTQELFNTVVNDKPLGYAHSIKEGLTTLPEHFSMYASLNHHFRSPVNAWFYKHLAGIKLNGFGFKDVVIEPKFITGINELKAEAFGIKVSYNNETFCVDSPYNFTLKFNGKEEKLVKGKHSFQRA